jgi:uncharacterized protein
MTEKIVINASPLIALGQMQIFDVVSQLPFEFVCPPQIEAEITAGYAKGLPVSFPNWINIISLIAPLSPLSVATLDEGEAAVIQLALEREIEIVCIDDLKGRRAATAVRLKVVGSLGLLGKAKTLGLINAVKPFIEAAQTNGIYYHSDLVKEFLNSFGE